MHIDDLYQIALNLDKKVGEKIGLEVRTALLLKTQLHSNGTFSKKILNDRILLEMRMLAAKKHNKLFDAIDRKIQQMFEGALFAPVVVWLNEILDKKMYEKGKVPFKVLTFDELEAGFVICFMPLLSTIFVFCSEWIVVLKDYILVKSIFDVFFKIQRNQLKAQSKNVILKLVMLKKIAEERQKQAHDGTRVAVKKSIAN